MKPGRWWRTVRDEKRVPDLEADRVPAMLGPVLEDWTETASVEGLASLAKLLARSMERLAQLPRPVAVAACPLLFDDAGRYPDWLGVHAGGDFWEQADYNFEFGQWRDPISGQRRVYLDDRVQAKGVLTEGARPAIEELHALQRQSWRSLAEAAFQRPLNDSSIGLVLQDEAGWFVISATNAGPDAAFLLRKDQTFLFVGAPWRMDQRMDSPDRVLRLTALNRAAELEVRSLAPNFPFVEVDDYV